MRPSRLLHFSILPLLLATPILWAAEDPWGIRSAAQAAEGRLYRQQVDTERTWFTEHVIDPHFAAPGAKPVNPEQERLVLLQAFYSRNGFAIQSPLGTVAAIDETRSLVATTDVPGADPLLAYAAWGLLKHANSDRKEANRMNAAFRRRWQADTALWESRYPNSLMIEIYNACLQLWESDDPRAEAKGAEIGGLLAGWYEKAWKAGEFTGRERALVGLIEDVSQQRSGAEVLYPRILALVADRDDWLAHTVRGKLAIAQAWVARGRGWASTVTEEGRKAFEERLAFAEREFETAWQKDPSRPEVPAGLVIVTFQTKGKVAAIEWFKRAISAEFDHDTAYSAMLNFLQPRWYGSGEEIAAFGTACLDSGRFDTQVPGMLIRALQINRRDGKDSFAATYGTRAWKARLEALAGGYERTLGKASPYANRMRTEQACFLWTVGDKPRAIAVLRTITQELRGWNRLSSWEIPREEIDEALAAKDPPAPAAGF